jgi:hypothetical protein
MDSKLHHKEYFAQENGMVRRQGLLLRIAMRRKGSQKELTSTYSQFHSDQFFGLQR